MTICDTIRKITILGTTGSGKTTFLETIFGSFVKNDVARNITKEQQNNLDFTPIDSNNFQESTTTISMNVIDSLFCLTHYNKLIYKQYKEKNQLDFENIEKACQVVLSDVAGQDRFDFMQDIAIKGSNLVIIMADGTNTSSIERLVEYFEKVKQEEQRIERSIPVFIFINKADLRDKGLFLGQEFAERIITSSQAMDLDINIYETSNFKTVTYEEPLRVIYTYLCAAC